MKVRVVPIADFPPGNRVIIEVGRRSIGVFRVGDRLFAVRNDCPHLGAPLCLGQVHGAIVSDEPGRVRNVPASWKIACPWHGWEFDLDTGRSQADPDRLRVRTFPVSVRREERADGTALPGRLRRISPDSPTREFGPPPVDVFPAFVEDDYVVIDVPD
ncbi:Rieske (2Fe-2S) protein [Nocardia jiangxiensis]|uniref:Rieske (2Fe-2S) protein n=1 Tax=Nocardia jiangxiensis TaxID=282685 RepID=A0ABW6S6N5_9NOCA